LKIKFRLFIYECSQTMKIIGRKNGIIKQLNHSIHSILFVHFDFFLKKWIFLFN